MLKHIFAGYRTLGWQGFFPLCPLKTLFHSLLVSIISKEKSMNIQIIVPLNVKCHFPQIAFSMFPLSLAFSGLSNDANRSIFIIFILLGVCWTSWTCQLIMSFTKLGDHLAIISSNIFFCPILSFFSFWKSNYTYTRHFDLIPQVPEAQLNFFQSFSLFFKLDNYYCSIFKFREPENMGNI